MTLVFKVRRGEAELVKPAKPTPNDVKSLSDWDDRVLLREWVSCILFYNSATTSDPLETIKKALADALVYYYPFAGRLKENGPDKRLVVDCTSEGVGFISADADARLDQFGTTIHPYASYPPYMSSKLLYNETPDFTGGPVFVIQVTRLACGGFTLGFSFNHLMSDVVGAVQFVTAVSELALGVRAPSVLPMWQRELLNAPPHHHGPPPTTQSDGHVGNPNLCRTQKTRSKPNEGHGTYRSFFFGAKELKAIQARLKPLHGDHFTSFELISACIFHCRVVSMDHAPGDYVCAGFPVNARSKFIDPPLPSGYYGNASFRTSIIRPMQCFHNLRYVVEEVKKAKEVVTEDYVRSLIHEQVIARSSDNPYTPPTYPMYYISDVSKVGLSFLDFGWGKPVYTGISGDDKAAHLRSFMVASTNNEGHEGKLITIYMPKDAMDKFDLTLRTLLGST